MESVFTEQQEQQIVNDLLAGYKSNQALLNQQYEDLDTFGETVKTESPKIVSIFERLKTNPILHNEDLQDEEIQQDLEDYSTPVSENEVNNRWNAEVHEKLNLENLVVKLQDILGVNKQYEDITVTKEGFEQRKESYNSTETDKQAESPIMYQQNTYTDENGEPQKCVEVAMRFDTSKFDFDFESESEESIVYNVDVLKTLYTNMVQKKIGGFDRVTSIHVADGKLILNKSTYVSMKLGSKEDVKNLREGLPTDLYEYVIQGMTGYFFDWSLLLKCSNLRTLVFDDYEFVTDVVAVDLNMTYVREDYFFTYLRKLHYLKMGEFEYTDEQDKNADDQRRQRHQRAEQAKVQDFVERTKAYYRKSTFDYNRLKPTTWTDKLDNHFHMCFKDYLKNRGKKGLIRYTGGVLIRGLFAAASTLLNAGTHFVGDTASYLSQYNPRLATDEETNEMWFDWGYRPNKRTVSDAPKFTSGDTVVNSQSQSTQKNFTSKPNSSTKQKPTTKKKESIIVEEDEGEEV